MTTPLQVFVAFDSGGDELAFAAPRRRIASLGLGLEERSWARARASRWLDETPRTSTRMSTRMSSRMSQRGGLETWDRLLAFKAPKQQAAEASASASEARTTSTVSSGGQCGPAAEAAAATKLASVRRGQMSRSHSQKVAARQAPAPAAGASVATTLSSGVASSSTDPVGDDATTTVPPSLGSSDVVRVADDDDYDCSNEDDAAAGSVLSVDTERVYTAAGASHGGRLQGQSALMRPPSVGSVLRARASSSSSSSSSSSTPEDPPPPPSLPPSSPMTLEGSPVLLSSMAAVVCADSSSSGGGGSLRAGAEQRPSRGRLSFERRERRTGSSSAQPPTTPAWRDRVRGMPIGSTMEGGGEPEEAPSRFV